MAAVSLEDDGEEEEAAAAEGASPTCAEAGSQGAGRSSGKARLEAFVAAEHAALAALGEEIRWGRGAEKLQPSHIDWIGPTQGLLFYQS